MDWRDYWFLRKTVVFLKKKRVMRAAAILNGRRHWQCELTRPTNSTLLILAVNKSCRTAARKQTKIQNWKYPFQINFHIGGRRQSSRTCAPAGEIGKRNSWCHHIYTLRFQTGETTRISSRYCRLAYGVSPFLKRNITLKSPASWLIVVALRLLMQKTSRQS